MLIAEISYINLKSMLSQKDQIYKSPGYKTLFTIVTNAKPQDPNQGLLAMDCEATWIAQGSFAMKIVYDYEKEVPCFVLKSSGCYKSIEYDQDGNLVLWRTLEKYILSTPDRNDTLKKLKVFFVGPDGQIAKTGDNMLLHQFPIDSPDSMYEFNQFQLATGRGLASNLDIVNSVKSLSSGLTKVTAYGSYGPGLQGSWELILDPNSDYLVREATLMTGSHDKPTIVIASDGVIRKDEVKMAKYGTFKYSNILDLSFEVTDISKVVGTNTLYEEVISRLNSSMPPGSEIIDMRGEKPVRTTVK